MTCECDYKFIKIIYSTGFRCPSMLYQCRKCGKRTVRALKIQVKQSEKYTR